MQNAEIAQALGVDTTKMYLIVFGIGSALAGLAGALCTDNCHWSLLWDLISNSGFCNSGS